MRHRPGIALANVLVLSLLTMSFVVIGIQFTQQAAKQGRKDQWRSQVYNVALAGISHAASWLQKQASEPASFDPKAVASTEPDEESETEAVNQQLGLVREFLVDPTGGLWGRYEVGRSSDAPARDGLATGPASGLYPSPGVDWTVEDVSLERGFSTAGTVWRVRSRAYVFKREEGGATPAPFSPTSPKPLGTLVLEGDVRKMRFNPPAAAIYCYRAKTAGGWPHIAIDSGEHDDHTTLRSASGSAARIWCNTDKIRWEDPGGNVDTDSSPSYTDKSVTTDTRYVDPDASAQLSKVFGVGSLAGIKALADRYVENLADVAPVAPMEFLYVKPAGGILRFGGTGNPNLNGGGVLLVEGNLSIDGSTVHQKFNGIIFVTGSYRQVYESTITGTVIAGGNFLLRGYHDREAKLYYSLNEINRVKDQLGVYKLQRSTLRVVS